MSFAAQLRSLEQRAFTALRARADARLARADRAAGDAPKPHHLLTGERGEAAAWFYLRGLGYTVVARRWRAAKLRGDLDLVAWDGATLVAVEVKTRTARDFYPAEVAVDGDKRNQLRLLAGAYLRHVPEHHRDGVGVRFDVLAVYLPPGGEPEFEHFRNAFPRAAPWSDRVRRS